MILTVQGDLLVINQATDIEKKQLYKLSTAHVQNFIRNRVKQRNNSTWDGKICMLIDGIYLPFGLWRRIWELQKAKIPYQVTINNLMSKFDTTLVRDDFEKWVKELDTPFEARQDQIDYAFKILQTRQLVYRLATSYGKTFLTYLTLRYLNDFNKLKASSKMLVIVPAILLVEQLFDDFESYQVQTYDEQKQKFNAHFKVYKIHSTAINAYKQNDCQVICGTYQSLINMPKDWFEQFDCVVLDECHKVEAKSIITLMCNCKHVSYKFGLSGSIDLNDKLLMLTLESYIGAHLGTFTLKEAIDKNITSNLYVKRLVLQHSATLDDKYAAYLNSNPSMLDNYTALSNFESAWLRDCKEANDVIAQIFCSLDMNSLVLVKRRGHVDNLAQAMINYCKAHNIHKHIHIIHGDVNLNDRQDIIDACKQSTKDNIIVATVQTLSTGVSIKTLFYAGFVNIGKSNNILLQSLGRLIRKHPQKQCATIIDIAQWLWLDKKYDKIPDSYRYRTYDAMHANSRASIYKAESLNYDTTPTIINLQ